MRAISRNLVMCLFVASILATSLGATTKSPSKNISKKSSQTYSVQEETQERPTNVTESSAGGLQEPLESLPDTPEDQEENPPHTEDTPVVFKLLDDEDEPPTLKGKEGRSKFPRVYYGEVEEEKVTSSKGIKGTKGKRYEYNHHEQIDHSSPHERHEGEEEYGMVGHRETEGYYGGRSPSYGDEYDGHHHGYHGHPYGPPAYRYHPAAEAIGKALKVLIPSALVLTGVSALFPNRIKVPTNDYINNANQHQRNKRSIDYNGGLREDERYLSAEHRSAGDSSEDAYAYNMGRYGGDFLPSENSNEFASAPEFKSWGLKSFPAGEVEADERKGDQLRPFMSRPSTPQEYDNFNFSPQVYNFIVPETTYEPEGIAAAPTDNSPTVMSTTEESASKISTGEMVKRKRRPFIRPSVSSTAASPAIIEELEKIAPYKKMPTEPTITSTTAKATSTSTSTQKTTTTTDSLSKDLSTANDKLEEVLNNLQALQVMGTQAGLMLEQKPSTSVVSEKKDEGVDLSPDGPVMGLITSYATHDNDSPACQKRALCDLAMRGRNHGASRFEGFLWNLASLVPEQFSRMYELEDIFKAIKEGDCKVFDCSTPNLDIQV